MEKTGVIFQLILVICATKNSVQIHLSQLFNSLLYGFVAANDDFDVVVLNELLDAISPEPDQSSLGDPLSVVEPVLPL